MGAFQALNDQGFPVNVANATPILFSGTGYNPEVVELTPEAFTDNIYILASQYYGLGVGATTPLAATYNLTLDTPATLRVYKNGEQLRSKNLPAGVSTVSTDTFDLDMPLAFGDTLAYQLVRTGEDATVTNGIVTIYQAKQS